MSTKRYKPEQIVNLLRPIEVEIANGKTTPQSARRVTSDQPGRVLPACQLINVTDSCFMRVLFRGCRDDEAGTPG